MDWVYATYQGIDHSVLDLDGDQTIAHNVRSKEDATLMAAAPAMAEALRRVQAIAGGRDNDPVYLAPAHRRLLGMIEATAEKGLLGIDDD